MNGAILVRGSWKLSDYGFVYLFASLGLIGAFIAFVVGHAWVGALFAIVPLGCALAIAWDVGRKNRSRRWVRDLGDGIVVIDRDLEFRVADSDFLAMALILKEQYYQGELQSHCRRFIVWTKADSPPGRIEMTNTIVRGSTDPLINLIQRVSDLLFQRTQDDLQSGQPAVGERWTVHKGRTHGAGQIGGKNLPPQRDHGGRHG